MKSGHTLCLKSCTHRRLFMMSARSILSVCAIASALSGCYGLVDDGSSSATSLSDGVPACGPLTDTLVSEAGSDVGSVAISNDDTGLDFDFSAPAPMASIRIYAGL